MAGTFSSDDWKKINAELDRDPDGYGLPRRAYGSLVLGSFNIRKCGSSRRRSAETWDFLGRMCRRFDLLAVQEVMDDLSGLERLIEAMGAEEYGWIVSDKTGAFPGDAGLNERLAFVYRRDVLRRGPIVSDVTYDRTKIHELLAENWDEVRPAVEEYRAQLAEWQQGQRKREPKLDLPVFLSFIRQPFTVSFQVKGHPEANPFEFMAVNAHLIYGERIADRKREFQALMEWIVKREENVDDDRFPGLILLGDLNLDFDNPASDIEDIQQYLKDLKTRGGIDIKVNFPFLGVHPGQTQVFRTNARLRETFDHIGFFYRATALPPDVLQRPVGSHERGPDYAVVNFVALFAKALTGKELGQLSKTKQKEFFAKFEHSVSDHMPIWVRVPLPD